MTNTKLYYLSQVDFDSQIKNGKYPLQQKQIYKALAAIGKPTRGMDAVDAAVKNEGLLTRQAYDVLAAWYFSPKRRPDCVRLGEPTVINESLEDRVTRLTDELEAKANELAAAEADLKKQVSDIEAEEDAAEDAAKEDDAA